MPFKKGQSGNINGRSKGSKNRVTQSLRESIVSFLENNFDNVQTDFEILTPRDRVKFYLDLLQYGLPKLQTVQMETDFDNLTDTELNRIIEELKTGLNEQKG